MPVSTGRWAKTFAAAGVGLILCQVVVASAAITGKASVGAPDAGSTDAGRGTPDAGHPEKAAEKAAAKPAPVTKPVTKPTPPVTPPPAIAKPAAKPPPPKPPTEEEKIASLLKKKQYDQACPLLEKLAKTSPDNAPLWIELAQCEQRRNRKKQVVEAASHAAEAGTKSSRKVAYQLLQSVREKVEVPPKGCEWLSEGPGGVCGEQMWACAYEWERTTPSGQAHGQALTFGVDDEEQDLLESALDDGSALRPQLAAEWKALQNVRVDEVACPFCHQHAIDSVDGLVNARAVGCFLQRTGHAQPLEICAQPDAECDTWTNCIDEAASVARRADGEKNRSLWPEAYDIMSAAHKVCEATCGVVETTRCDVVSVDACRGLVGYACVHTRRGRRPTIRIGELSLTDGNANWDEAADPVKPAP